MGLHAIWHWLTVHTGSSNMPGVAPNYNFWSGFGSDLSEFAIVGAVLGAWRKHNCHTRRCWRVGRHVVDGTPWCNRHHQDARAAVAESQVSGGSTPFDSRERLDGPPATAEKTRSANAAAEVRDAGRRRRM